MSFGVKIPDSHCVVATGGEEVVVFGVNDEVGDGVVVSFEHFDHFVFVDGPIEDEMSFFGGNQNCAVVVSMCELFDLMNLHEQFAVAFGVVGEVDVEGLAICYIEYLSIIGEVESDDIFGVFLDDFGGF